MIVCNRGLEKAILSGVLLLLSACGSTIVTSENGLGPNGYLGNIGPAKASITKFTNGLYTHDRIRLVTGGETGGIKIYSSTDGKNWDVVETRMRNIDFWGRNHDVTIASTSDDNVAVVWMNDLSGYGGLLAYSYYDPRVHSATNKPYMYTTYDGLYERPAVIAVGDNVLLAAPKGNHLHYSVFPVDYPPIDLGPDSLMIEQVPITDPNGFCDGAVSIAFDMSGKAAPIGLSRHWPHPVLTGFIEGDCAPEGATREYGFHMALFELTPPWESAKLVWTSFIPTSVSGSQLDRNMVLSVSTRDDREGGAVSAFSYLPSGPQDTGETVLLWNERYRSFSDATPLLLEAQGYPSIDVHVNRIKDRVEPGVRNAQKRRVVVTASQKDVDSEIIQYSWDFEGAANRSILAIFDSEDEDNPNELRQVTGRNAISVDFLSCLDYPDGNYFLTALWEEGTDLGTQQARLRQNGFGLPNDDCEDRRIQN